jgi:hypothetical protein
VAGLDRVEAAEGTVGCSDMDDSIGRLGQPPLPGLERLIFQG